MNTLTVSRRSWHYKLAYKSFTSNLVCASRYTGMDNLCDYVSRIGRVVATLFGVAWFFSVTPFILYSLWVFGSVLPPNGVPHELTPYTVCFGVWLLIGIFANMMAACVIAAVVAFAGISLLVLGASTAVAAVVSVPTLIFGEDNKASSSFALIKGWLVAVKDKMCPFLEIVD